MVPPDRRATVPSSTRRSLMPVRCSTVPSELMIAVNPVGAACRTHRPLVIAASRDAAICWD
jgi:hypothetical protein